MNEQLVLLMMGVFYNQIGHILAGESYNLSTAPLKSSFTDPHLDCLILSFDKHFSHGLMGWYNFTHGNTWQSGPLSGHPAVLCLLESADPAPCLPPAHPPSQGSITACCVVCEQWKTNVEEDCWIPFLGTSTQPKALLPQRHSQVCLACYKTQGEMVTVFEKKEESTENLHSSVLVQIFKLLIFSCICWRHSLLKIHHDCINIHQY